MKILITGVAGFIGSNLAVKLLNEGYTVYGIDNFSYGNWRNLAAIKDHPKFKFIEGDLTNHWLIEDIHPDLIYHLASQKIPRYSGRLRTLDENYSLTQNVLKKAHACKSKIVFASTSDVYGKNPDVPFSEESNLVLGSTEVKRWAYAVSKIYSEHLLHAHGESGNLEYTIVRFFGSYGPNQNLSWWGGPQSVFIGKAMNNEPIEIHGTGKQTRTFSYVDDTTEALLLIAKNREITRNKTYNIAGLPNEEIAIDDLARMIWKKVRGNEDPKINYIPYSTFGKYEDVERRVPVIDKIVSELGYKPKTDLSKGLDLTIDWQKSIQ